MNVYPETKEWQLYLRETDVIDFSHPDIQHMIAILFNPSQSEIEKVKLAFEFVRDNISHSWDIQSRRVTRKASNVLKFKEGICYAKSNLLAALLRSQGIPTGFCYQRLTLFDTPDQGYCLHALNATYLKSIHKWIRMDARGNKKGIQAQFSLDQERLAFIVREELGEKDYPIIYADPNRGTMTTLEDHRDA